MEFRWSCIIFYSPHRETVSNMDLHNFMKKQNIILADGAMGTYYALLTADSATKCELANLQNPQLIRRIHSEYLSAGASFLRTNTFSANTAALHLPLKKILDIIQKGYELAAEAASGAGREVVVAADIGPIYNNTEDISPIEEYYEILDAFFSCGADTFLFETFGNVNTIKKLVGYIKERNSKASIIASFTFSPDGYTRKGIPLERIMKKADAIPELDVLGVNCGVGPSHMQTILNRIPALSKPLSLMPNAGYPTLENNRTVFESSPTYFANTLAQLPLERVKIIGGCCGTTPSHIRGLGRSLKPGRSEGEKISAQPAAILREEQLKSFNQKLNNNGFPIVAELDPPYSSDISKLLVAAERMKEMGIDAVTLSDSPMARAKIDSIVCAARVARETGLDVIPHLCCRDKNSNALRASLLAAHSENIRNILAVTGDPVPEHTRGFIKPVFNMYSAKLMELIREMNDEQFYGAPIHCGGALNINAANQEAELERVKMKWDSGGEYVFSQPVFDLALIPFLERVRKTGMKVLAGLLPIVSYRNAQYLHNEVPGINIPEEILSRFTPEMGKEEAVEAGVQTAAQIARELKEHADGFYIMTPFNRSDIVAQLLEKL